MQLMSLPPGVSDAGLPHVTGVVNLIAVAIVMVITAILVIGIKESANFNSAVVIIKVTIVGVFLVVGGWFLFKHPGVAELNWHPFIPPADGHGNFGWGGIPTAAASIFFAYIGFDAVSTAAQEAKNPKRDMPIGILGSLVVCTILYILVSLVLTGLVSYKTLNVSAPVALAIDATGVGWGSLLVKIGAVFGLATVMLVMLLGQTRVFYSMSKDGLLPKWASAVHPQFPHAVDHDDRVRRFCGHHAGVLQHRCAFGAGEYRNAAGLHHCLRGGLGVARPPSGHGAAVQDAVCSRGADSWDPVGRLSDDAPDAVYLGSDDRLAAGRTGDLLRLLVEAQQGAAIAVGNEVRKFGSEKGLRLEAFCFCRSRLPFGVRVPVEDRSISPEAREILINPANELFFSVSSIWEIAIKRGLRRQDLIHDPREIRREMIA